MYGLKPGGSILSLCVMKRLSGRTGGRTVEAQQQAGLAVLVDVDGADKVDL